MGHDLDDLALFVDVIREGGIRAVATARGIPRSTVSRRLKRLEADLGITLMQRTGHRVQVSDAGAAHFDRLCRLVDEARDVCTDLMGRGREPRGVLRVAAAPVFADHVLPELAARYLSEHPKVRLEVHMSVEHIDLLAERMDLAFRTGPLSDSSSLAAKSLGHVTLGFYASPAYASRHGLPASIEALAEHDLLVATHRSAGSQWLVELAPRNRTIRVQGRIQAQSAEFLRQMCERGMGIARLPMYQVAPSVRRGALVPVLQSHWLQTDLHAVYPLTPPPKTRAFLELALQAFEHRDFSAVCSTS